MNTATLLCDLEECGVRFETEDGHLRYHAPTNSYPGLTCSPGGTMKPRADECIGAACEHCASLRETRQPPLPAVGTVERVQLDYQIEQRFKQQRIRFDD